LAALKMGVRVNRPGKLSREYQTAGGTHRLGDTYGIVTADGKSRRAAQSTRYYLADADFLVGLQGDETFLRKLDAALAAPTWQIFLGRKAFLPSQPVRLPADPPEGSGLRLEDVETALALYAWPEKRHAYDDDVPSRLRLVTDVSDQEVAEKRTATEGMFDMPVIEARHDVPISFELRQFGMRYVRSTWLDRPQEVDADVSVPTDTEPA
jgi:CRISPR system Cascade subunit CasD